jgi:hypothetical protein
MEIRSTNLPGRSKYAPQVGLIPEMRFISGFCRSGGVQDLKLQELICLVQLLKSDTKSNQSNQESKVTTVTQEMLAGNRCVGYSDSTTSGTLVVETQVKCGPVNPTSLRSIHSCLKSHLSLLF